MPKACVKFLRRVGIFFGLILLLGLCWIYKDKGALQYLGVISTVVIAVFAGVTWWIAYSQHKMYNDPELRVTSPKISKWKYKTGKGGVWDLEIALINPGAVPIEIDGICEYEKGKEKVSNEFPGEFKEAPEEKPVGVYITQLPWVIEKGHFAISKRRVCAPDIEGSIGVVIQYFVNRPKMITTISPSLKSCKCFVSHSDKEIIGMLKSIKIDLSKKLSLFYDIRDEIYKERLRECLVAAREKIIYILDDLQDRIKKGYNTKLSKVAGSFRKAIEYLTNSDEKWAEFDVLIRQLKDEIDNIIKEWDKDI